MLKDDRGRDRQIDTQKETNIERERGGGERERG